MSSSRAFLSTILSTVQMLSLLVLLSGCGSKEGDSSSAAFGHHRSPADHEIEEAHAAILTNGPHGGHVYRIGDSGEYHAEMVFDPNSRNITLFFSGPDSKKPRPASDIIFEPEVDGRPVILKAVPSPLDGETVESCSRFVIEGRTLPEKIVQEEQLEGHFHVTFDGKEFQTIFFAHSHDGDRTHSHDSNSAGK